jgi:perosamine synthetase
MAGPAVWTSAPASEPHGVTTDERWSGVNVPAARIVFSDDDRAAVLSMIDEALRTGSLTLGPHTRELEESFRTRHDAPYAVAVSSGTSALEIILRSLGVEGREVVVPANTFFATAAAVLHAGGGPRFADVAQDTLALSAETVEAALTENTAGVIVVHIGGLISPEVEAIRQLCDARGLFLVEDAAHAHGSSLDGRPAGAFGVAGAFSFYPTKIMTTGEGGMIVTADERIRDDAVIYRDQGKAGFLGGDHVRLGYAWRMSELHAAMGLVQLRRLDEFIKIRREVADQYDEALAAIDGITPLVRHPSSETNFYKYIAMLDPNIDRQDVKATLREEHGVSLSGEVYASPLHHQPVFAGLHEGSLPVAEDVCRRHVCLPIHSDMTRDEAAHVVASLRAVLGAVD